VTGADRAAAAFDVAGSIVSVEPHPTGHINDAFLVSTDNRRYLLQRLNPSVFTDPDAVMANIVTVTTHLRSKGEPTLTIVAERGGRPSWRDDAGDVWRMYQYLEGAHPLDVRSPGDAAVVGRAFGRMHRLLVDLDPARLRISLPRFHDPARRLGQMEAAVESDPHDRLRNACGEVNALRTLGALLDADSMLAGLPTRVAHNDAKAVNLLVEEIGGREPLVVDLDTVMPGSVLWDVGDMIRSSTGTPDESSATVAFDIDRYHALVDAWLSEMGEVVTQDERDAVPRSGLAVTLEQAARFIADHILGDVYFRVSRPGENLERARNQLDLLRSMMATLGPRP
jgi:Ser/Thr protein kinase RdoA (MazF antagonist)